jgi:hypothetical protein
MTTKSVVLDLGGDEVWVETFDTDATGDALLAEAKHRFEERNGECVCGAEELPDEG